MQAVIIGCGYLGLRVAHAWQSAGHSVAALTRSAERAAAFTQHGITPILGDVLQPATLQAIPDCHVVLYAVGYDRSSGISKRQVYVEGLMNVVHALKGRVKTFVYISSTSVYGQRDGSWIDEQSACEPASDDGRICLAAEEVVHSQLGGKDSPIRAMILRLSGIYGPERLLRRIETLRAHSPIEGNPDAYLNLIHVDDAAAAVLAASERGAAGETYLISDDRPIRRRDYYTLLARLVGAADPIFPNVDSDAGLNKRCRNAKMRGELGVALRYPTIETGLPHAVNASS